MANKKIKIVNKKVCPYCHGVFFFHAKMEMLGNVMCLDCLTCLYLDGKIPDSSLGKYDYVLIMMRIDEIRTELSQILKNKFKDNKFGTETESTKGEDHEI